METRIAINGASGRIGRAVTYELISTGGDWARVALLNDPVGIDKIRTSLADVDPVHGRFPWTVEKADENHLSINGQLIPVFAQKDLVKIPFADLGVAYVEECSGFYDADKNDKTRKPAQAFLDQGVRRVFQSYPATADIAIVMGANHDLYDPTKHRLISNASCTTKAVVAPLRPLLDEGIGIESVLLDTVHATTNSQSPLSVLNQISTHKTGAVRAVGEILTGLAGKLDGMSFRVPTLDGSFASIYMVVTHDGDLSAADVNAILRTAVDDPRYAGRLGVLTGKEANSMQDVVGRTENGLVVLSKTRVHALPYRSADGKRVSHLQIVSGYDNERGPPKDQTLLTAYVAQRD